MLDGLVASIHEARIPDRHGAGAERRDGVIADVREPHVLDRAGAVAVDAVAHALTHDHVANGASVGHLEQRRGAALVAGGAVVEIALVNRHAPVVGA